MDNLISGNNANNSLNGGAGNDSLDGGLGIDTLIGGAGNDTYFVDSVNDIVTESLNSGTDIIRSSLTLTLASNVENLSLIGIDAINGTGNTLANTLVGNLANNVLSGGTGTDTLIGGVGNDTYVVDVTAEIVTENFNEGIDVVQSSATYTLSTNLENLILTTTSAINGTGNALDNVLTGNAAINTLTGAGGNDTLDGGAGNDSLVGGTGDDSYLIDSSSDVITENLNEGIDIVKATATYTLSNNTENLILLGIAAINGTGNGLNNTITGNSAANTLSGGAGIDTLVGGAGNDTYVVDNSADIANELGNEGTDLVQSSAAYTLSNNVENLTLTGSSIINATGNALNNTLTGNSVANILTGGAGDDTYFITSGDTVTEATGEGTDTVNAGFTYTLATNVENLTLTGTTAINGTGNTLNNILVGNSAINTLAGGVGDDSYFITSGDIVTETTGAGTDTVNAGFTYTLATNVENLTLTGTTAINGTGNTLSNVLTGNSAVNTLTGGAGDDTYIIGTGDIVVEVASAGTDTVQSSVTYTLAANVENLTLNGTTSINGTGNALINSLVGNSASNILNGGTGNDTLTGGTGVDSFVFDTALSATTNNDIISDFNVVDDTINLKNTIFTKLLTTGVLSSANFVSGAGAVALDSNDYLVYNTTSGSLSYDADGNGAGAKVDFVTLTGIPAVTAADFLVF